MKRESVAFAISGILFGLMVGWIIGTQYATGRAPQAPAAQAQAQSGTAGGTGSAQPPVLDEATAKSLADAAAKNPQDAGPRIDLANLYFDAERFPDAIKWYEEALKLEPKNVNASTDLGVSYYYSNQPDLALKQFDYSLSVDPKHLKTLLNQGIVLAFGKQDLNAAVKAWEQVVAIAPDGPEARAAKQALEGVRAAHPDGTGTVPGAGAAQPANGTQ
ncbi:MAG: tetratricopeptide repeat protein [Vicinamibacterales bacterium]